MIWAILIFGILFLSIVGICFASAIFYKDTPVGGRILASTTGILILVGVWNGTGWLIANIK